LRSWKTALIGILSGSAYTFISAISTGVKPKDAIISIGLALLGLVAKDYDKTNSPTPVETHKAEPTQSSFKN